MAQGGFAHASLEGNIACVMADTPRMQRRVRVNYAELSFRVPVHNYELIEGLSLDVSAFKP